MSSLLTITKATEYKGFSFENKEKSPLAQSCDYHINYPFEKEADRLGVAPTSSTTVQLVLGDAIALTLSTLKGFSREDFYKFHPGGALGSMLSSEANKK